MKDALLCSSEPIVVKSKHFSDASHADLVEDCLADGNYLQSEMNAIQHRVDQYVRTVVNDGRSGTTILKSPKNVFLTDHSLNAEERAPTDTCSVFFKSQLSGIAEEIRLRVEGPDSPFVLSAAAISSLLDDIVNGADSPQAPSFDFQYATAPFRRAITEAIKNCPKDSFIKRLRTMYTSMNQRYYHVRMRNWGRDSGNDRWYNTPSNLADTLVAEMEGSEFIKAKLVELYN